MIDYSEMKGKLNSGQINSKISDVFIQAVIRMRGKQKRFERFGEKYREAKEAEEKKVDDIIAKLTDSQGVLF
jgi:L-arabinose isomerase